MRLARTGDGGAVAILVAILATVLFAFAAIVVDLGYARTVQSDAQSSVDAASLAGASILAKDSSPSGFTSANAAIKESALANFGTTDADWAACSATKPSGPWVQAGSGTDCILFKKSPGSDPTKLQVVLPTKHVGSFFGGLVGYGGMDVGAHAQATIRQDDVPGCALCVQGLLDTSGQVAVDGGVDGGSSSAGNGLVRAGGSVTVQDPGAITFAATPSPATGPSYSSTPLVRPVTDPFAGSPMPSGPGGSLLPDFPVPVTPGTVTCGPTGVPSLAEGVYRNITVNGPCPATGVIVVTGRLRVTSTGSLTGGLSVIQLSCGTRTKATVCGPSTSGGRLQIDAGGRLDMFASLTGFSLVADPNNRSAMTINGDMSVDQAIYGRSTAVTVGSGASVTSQGIVSMKALTIRSGGAVSVTAPGGAPVPGPVFVGLYR